MNITIKVVFSIVMAANIWLYPQVSNADGFTGADLLKWGPKNQNFYFQVSVSMAGVIVAQRNEEQARCIDQWHERQNAKEYSGLLNAVEKYPSYHPQGVIYGYLEKACGKLR